MTQRAAWDITYSVGHPELDQQHQSLLELCNALADAIEQGCDEPAFRVIFDDMLTTARAHFALELQWLDAADGDTEALDQERSEFEYLADDIITTENFEMTEIQRFLTLWWVGHMAGLAKSQGDQP